jgi:phage gpG-like protein
MFNVKVDDSKVQLWLTTIPAQVHARLETEVYTLVEKLRNHVITDKLLGQVLQRRSGRLGQSIQQRVTSTQSEVTGMVYSAGDVPYARIHEYGGKTAAHIIEARNAEALSFVMGGRQVFAKKVNHPGSVMPERSYMRSSLRDMKDEIIEGMKRAVGEGLQP